MTYTFFIGGLTGGGAERVLCNLANYMVSHGHNVEIVTMSETASYSLDSRISYNVLLKEVERSNFVINTYKRLSRFIAYLRKRKCDAYIVMLPTTSLLLLSLHKLAKAPIIASERSFPKSYNSLTRLLLKLFARKAAGWVFQTPIMQEWYLPCLGKSKSVVIPNAVNNDFIREPYTGKRRMNIVSVGRLIQSKRFDILITAFSRIALKHPSVNIVIYGQGECLHQLQQLASDLGISDRVKFPGHCKNIAVQIEDSQMFVLSSELEGIPNVLVEAMALGLPCIATDCDGGGARMIISNRKNGILVPKNNVEELANAIDELLSDKILARRLSENAIAVRTEYASDVVYGRWNEFINKIVLNQENENSSYSSCISQ